MCGLTGLLRASSSDDIRAIVARMTARLVHRGPDDEGVWAEEGVGLGHRRLAILDLSPTGAQPMHSDCGRYVLAYNGEVYNHLDMRHALETAGAGPSKVISRTVAVFKNRRAILIFRAWRPSWIAV